MRATPAWFAWKASRGEWKIYPHLACIHEHLMDVYAGRCKRLIVELPPRHGKSELISKYFPAWWLLNRPKDRVILSSYEFDFARSWGRKAREIAAEQAYVFNVQLADSSSQHDWETKDGGGMFCAGVGGPCTGRGANLLILDDPIKNAEQALSATYREKLWAWWISTASTRLEPGGACIIMHTRWHEDDLIGRLLKNQPGDWRRVTLPALAEGNDIMGREPGEALWPEKFSIEELQAKKRTAGSYWWSALYQQNPTAEGGNIFKEYWFKHYMQTPLRFDYIVHSWDMSFKDGASSSYVVGQVWGMIGADKYLLHQVREQADFVRTLQMFIYLVEKFPQYDSIIVESKANGPAVVSTLKDKFSGIIEVEPYGSKEARAHAISPQMESGNIFFPSADTSWVPDFLDEVKKFPSSAKNDQVDAMTQAILYLREKEQAVFNREVDVVAEKLRPYKAMLNNMKIKSMR